MIFKFCTCCYNNAICEKQVEYGPPLPLDDQFRELRGHLDFDFEFGEPDDFGVEFMAYLRERIEFWKEAGEPLAYFGSLMEAHQKFVAEGKYWVGKSNFVDGILKVGADLYDASGSATFMFAMIVESISIPPPASIAA